MIEAFGAGTAAVVAPVKKLHYDGIDYEIPINKDLQAGDLTHRLAEEIVDIQTGKKKFDDWVITI